MTFTDFVCLFLVGPGRRAADGEDGGRSTRPGALADPAGGGGRRGPVDGGGQAGGDRTAKPAREDKNAVGRCIRTGPQPLDQNTSLDPNSAQLKQPTEPHMRTTQRAALPSV